MLSKLPKDPNKLLNDRICELEKVDPDAAFGARLAVYAKKKLLEFFKPDDSRLSIDHNDATDDGGH